MEDAKSPNPLVEPGRPATSLDVQLHPLVLLAISDYVTRHTLRQQTGPIVGAIIGQQNGRQYTLEHAYECKLATEGTSLDRDWFTNRLEDYKEVHKVPALDLVAIFMLGPIDGPQPAHVGVLEEVEKLVGAENNVLLLLFHPEAELVGNLQGGKLPISLYESVQEVATSDGGSSRRRFRELAFEVETGEAEMIAVDFVAKGGGNATSVQTGQKEEAEGSGKDKKAAGKGKAKQKEESPGTNGALSSEDEDLIASLTAKVNAIKMLNQRINLIRAYLTSLPESTLTDAESTTQPPETTNYALLRSVSSLLSRLPLLAPPTPSTQPLATPTNALDAPVPVGSPLDLATQREREDVHLTSLLASLTRSIDEAQTLGNRFGIVQREKQAKDRSMFGRGPGRGLNMALGEDSSLLSAGEGLG